MRVDLDINGARVTITGDRLQVSVAEQESSGKASERVDPSTVSVRPCGHAIIGSDGANAGGRDETVVLDPIDEKTGNGPVLIDEDVTLRADAEAFGSPVETGAPISKKIKLAPITVLRPNCLSPDSCAGHGRNHCHRCRKVLAEGEAA